MTQQHQPPTQPSQGNWQQNSPFTKPPQIQDKRKLENFILNVVLYVAALLLVGAAALLITGVASAPIRVGLIAFGAVVFYVAGLATYRWVPKLRLASYSFTATGIAFLPLLGWALYSLLWHNGPAVWAVTSVLGTILVFFAASIMRERVMAYLVISFLVSDILSASKLLQLSMIWYFVALLVLATALKLFIRIWGKKIPGKLLSGFLDSSLVFVPATAAAALFLYPHFAQWELALIFVLATAYALTLVEKPISISLYIQGRVYSLLAVFFLARILSAPYWSFLPWLLASCLLLISAFFIERVSATVLPWKPIVDAQATWWAGFTLGLISELILTTLNLTRSAYAGLENQFNLNWLFMQDATDSSVLFPAWILPVITLFSVIFFARKVAVPSFYGILGSISLAYCVILGIQGSSIALLATGIVALIAKPHARRSVLINLLGGFIVALAMTLIIAQTLPLKPHELLLLLALLVSAFMLAQTIFGKNSATEPVTDKLFMPLMIGSLVLVHIFLFAYYGSIPRDLPPLFEFSFASRDLYILTGAVLSAIIVLGALVILLKRKKSSPQSIPALMLFYSEQVLAVLPIFVSEDIATFIFFVLLFIFNAIVFFLLPEVPRFTSSIALRILLVVLFVKVLFVFTLDDRIVLPALLLLLILLSLVSVFSYRRTSSKLEVGLGIGLAFFSYPVAFYVFLSNPQKLLPALAFLVPALLATLWLFLSRQKTTQLVFSFLVTPAVISMCLGILIQFVTRPSREVFFEVPIWSGIITVVLTKILAAMTKPVDQIKDDTDPFANWGSNHNPLMVLPGLVIFSLFYISGTWWISTFSALVTLLIAVGICGLQSHFLLRNAVWVFGALLSVLRLMIEFEDFSGSFALFESVTVLLIAVAALQIGRTDKVVSSVALLWTALGVHTCVSLFLLLGNSVPVSIERRIILLVFSILLLVVVALNSNKILIIAAAALITLQVLWMSGGLNPFTLFALGIALMGMVIWRLLARKDDLPQADSTSVPPVPVEPTATSAAPMQETTTQTPPAPSVVPEQAVQTPQEQRLPWQAPEGAEIKPFRR